MKGNEIQYWDSTEEKLAHSQSTKIRRLLDGKHIDEQSDGTFIILPIADYNSTLYRVSMNGDVHCNCQGFASRVKKGEIPVCSHILAVKNHIMRKKANI